MATTTSADQYRQIAWDCLKLAEGTSTPETRASMLSLAQEWVRLAEQSDRSAEYTRAGYRAKGWECLSRAESITDPERRADLLGYGRLWMSLAEPTEVALRGAYELLAKRAAYHSSGHQT
jgi:hypothetical protein